VSRVDPAQAKRTTQVLWLALLASQVAYAAIILSGAARIRAEPPDVPILPLVLGASAIGIGLLAHYFWRRATGSGRPLASPPPPQTAFTHYLLAWVLDESLAIYGLVLSLLGFPDAAWAPFNLAAFVLMLLHRPRAGG
jgi:F0F1-type ATP synthase membrane subunit c/vacuolar-type H+-ATPase subunit K